jgi:hypothetical protein
MKESGFLSSSDSPRHPVEIRISTVIVVKCKQGEEKWKSVRKECLKRKGGEARE